MIDIKHPEFMDTFDINKATVGVIGHGFVGKSVSSFFSSKHGGHACKVLVYDKAQPELGTLEDVVKNAEVIFICVPTPMKNDGSCYTGIAESVIDDVRRTADQIGRETDSFVLVMKSTVRPGFTKEMQKKHPDMRILFSPEFLTEKNAVKDFETCNRIILGGFHEDARVVFKYFEGIIPGRVQRELTYILNCDSTVAEMVKLYANGMLFMKVLFSNEIYLICEKLGIPFDEVRTLALLDQRIGAGHTAVPGPDGQLGAGGHCFPKDMNNLKAVARDLGTNEKLFTAILARNNEVREDKDWLRMKDRAVIDA